MAWVDGDQIFVGGGRDGINSYPTSIEVFYTDLNGWILTGDLAQISLLFGKCYVTIIEFM